MKYLSFLYVAMVALLLNCTSTQPKACSAAELATIQAECLALEAVGCPDAAAGDGGQGGDSGIAACVEVKASCAARVNAWEDCR